MHKGNLNCYSSVNDIIRNLDNAFAIIIKFFMYVDS